MFNPPSDVEKKVVSIRLPLPEWLALRREAARRKTKMTYLCVEWLQPHLDRLPKESPSEETKPS